MDTLYLKGGEEVERRGRNFRNTAVEREGRWEKRAAENRAEDNVAIGGATGRGG
jgi:hypothetical protein